MSDISIPGVRSSSGMNTSQMIEDLMEVERIPVRRMEREVETYETQRTTWQAMSRQVAQLRDASRLMYGFESPFRERVARVDGPPVLTATATRQAEELTDELTVVQTAGRDRFASGQLDRALRIEAGSYEFGLGDERATVSFGGGTLREFAGAINEQIGELVQARVVNSTTDSQVIIFEGQRDGADARLAFEGATAALAERLGVVAPARPDNAIALFADEALALAPGETRRTRLDRPFTVEPGMHLTFEARVLSDGVEPWTPPEAPPGVTRPDPGGISLDGISIRNEQLDLDVPEYVPPTPPPVVEDNSVASVAGGGRRVTLPDLPLSETFQTITVRSGELPRLIEEFAFDNRNTARRVEIRDIQLRDPAVRGDSAPLNALDQARDARILYNGVEVQRPANEIDDLIPGVTLNLQRAGDEPVQLTVEPDRETTKDAIIQLVGFYNQVVRDINIYTRTDPAIIDQIDYFDEAEREQMQERLGIFQGDGTLNRMRSRLQTIMMDPYDSGDSSLRLLAQLGISTNASGAAGGIDAGRLRGYLEINEAQLDSALETNFDAVAGLFGRDTDGDLVTDSGVAVALHSYVQPFVQTGGIIPVRTDTLDTRIDQTETRITRYNDRLETYEQRLRNEFGQMEGALEQLQDSQDAFDNLPQIGGGQ